MPEQHFISKINAISLTGSAMMPRNALTFSWSKQIQRPFEMDNPSSNAHCFFIRTKSTPVVFFQPFGYFKNNLKA